MHTATLGPVGPEVSLLGLGCMSMTGSHGTADPHEAAATLLEALDSGVTLFDTGDFYGRRGERGTPRPDPRTAPRPGRAGHQDRSSEPPASRDST